MDRSLNTSVIEDEVSKVDQIIRQTVSSTSNVGSVMEVIQREHELLFNEYDIFENEGRGMKDTIAELLNTKNHYLNKLENLKSSIGYGSEDTREEINAVKNEINLEDQHFLELKQQTAVLTDELEKLKQQRDQASETEADMSAKLMSEMKLYTQMSRIKWDYAKCDEGDSIAGFIVNPSKKDITPFNLSNKEHSQYFITNFLWKQIASDFMQD